MDTFVSFSGEQRSGSPRFCRGAIHPSFVRCRRRFVEALLKDKEIGFLRAKGKKIFDHYLRSPFLFVSRLTAYYARLGTPRAAPEVRDLDGQVYPVPSRQGRPGRPDLRLVGHGAQPRRLRGVQPPVPKADRGHCQADPPEPPADTVRERVRRPDREAPTDGSRRSQPGLDGRHGGGEAAARPRRGSAGERGPRRPLRVEGVHHGEDRGHSEESWEREAYIESWPWNCCGHT